ncbi:hypothetical protein [Paenisporosarcina sp. TG20]|uniref:hypothetical protein n=1 Tax=Paenisporosarcina sp. TG20 TaxID=1211706 RepID=UPI0012F65C02|nr:hypothetical protein [Paenisporosarcina sp. TG20]
MFAIKVFSLSFMFLSTLTMPGIGMAFFLSGINVVFPSISEALSNDASYYGILLACLSGEMLIGTFLSEKMTEIFSIG